MELVILVVSALAGARTYRALTKDDISFAFRQRVVSRFSDTWLGAWFCPFCWGFWLTAIIFSAGILSDGHWIWWLYSGSMAANYVGAHLNSRLD